jgi:hypothetical protein
MVSLFLGFFQDYVMSTNDLFQYHPVLYQSLTWSCGSLLCDPLCLKTLNQEGHPTCIPTTHEPVTPLISFKVTRLEVISTRIIKKIIGSKLLRRSKKSGIVKNRSNVVYYESIKRELKIRCIYECRCGDLVFFLWIKIVYYESIKREPKIRGIKKCPCDERLKLKQRNSSQVYLQQNKKKARAEGNSCHA